MSACGAACSMNNSIGRIWKPMQQESSNHLAMIISILAVLVAVFGTMRQHDRDSLERISKLEAKVESLHEVCCSEIGGNYASSKMQSEK